MSAVSKLVVIPGAVGVALVPPSVAESSIGSADSTGRRLSLGRVARGELREFEIPEEIAQESFRIRIVPRPSAWSLLQDDYAVKTNPLDLEIYSQVTLWLESDLRQSKVETTRGSRHEGRGVLTPRPDPGVG